MRGSTTVGNSLALLVSVLDLAHAKYDTTICNRTRFGELDDSRMC